MLLLRIFCLIVAGTVFEWLTNLIPDPGVNMAGAVLRFAIVGIPVLASLVVFRKDKFLKDKMAGKLNDVRVNWIRFLRPLV